MRDAKVQEQVARVEALLDKLEALRDPTARATAVEGVQALLELYGEGLARVVEIVAQRGGEELLEALAGDELVSHLLILHDLHPVDVETRVLRALQEVRPYMESHGGNVEFLGVDGGVAHLRLQGSCRGCHASTMTLKLAIERAIRAAAPELDGVEAEGVVETVSHPVTVLSGPGSPSEGESPWVVVGALPQLSTGGPLLKEVAGESVLFLRLEDDYYAYQHRCPGCGASLERADLRGRELACPGCEYRYDVHGAGRCLDAPQLYLEPVPLLVGEQGVVKVALRSAVG